MIRAAATGRIDYSKSDGDSYMWRLRERMMLDEVERDDLLVYTVCKQLQQVTTASGPSSADVKAELYTTHYERGNAHLQSLGKLLFPYMKWDDKAHYKSELASMKAEYIAKFGDPSSPEAREQARRDLESIKRRQLAAEQKVKADAEAQVVREREIQRLRSKRTTYKKR